MKIGFYSYFEEKNMNVWKNVLIRETQIIDLVYFE